MYDRSDHVRVTNGTDKPIKGRWDGKDYMWKPGAHLDVPLIVAKHVFGFGGSDVEKMNAFHNLGWARTTNDLETAEERMQLIQFADCPELVEVSSIGNVRPLVNAGGESGGRHSLPPPDEPSADEGDTL
jgi:hypothetical protein